MGTSNHAIVVGAGIAGLGVAYFLSKEGMDVTVLDKDNGKNNCSYGNAGMIVPSHIVPLASPGIISKGLRWMLQAESPFYIRPRLDKRLFKWGWKFQQSSTEKHVEESGPILRDLLLANRELLIQIEEDEKLDFGFKKNGLLNLCKTQKCLDEESEVAEKANALGIPASVLSAEETRKMEPGLDMDIIGSTYFPMDCHLHPGSLLNKLKKRMQERGVTFRYHANVVGLHKSNRKAEGVVTTDGTVFEGSHVVLCPGAWTPELAANIGLSLPMQAGKGYSITLNNPRQLPDICALLSETKVSMTPMNGMLRFGGTMEIVGIDTSINPVKLRALKKSVCSFFPEFYLDDFDDQEIWVGLRPISPDGLPYVGAVDCYENVFTSTGHAMMGMSLGIASGLIISQLILDGEAKLSHRPIDPEPLCITLLTNH